MQVGSVGTMTLSMVLTISTLLPISSASFLALIVAAINCTAYMDANGQNSLADKLRTVPGLDADPC